MCLLNLPVDERERIRVKIATAAMQAIITQGMNVRSLKRNNDANTMAEIVAQSSVHFADAMIRELSKPDNKIAEAIHKRTMVDASTEGDVRAIHDA